MVKKISKILIVLASFFACSVAHAATVSFVQGTSNYSNSVTLGSSVTAGNLLVIFLQEGYAAGTQLPDPSVTDTLGLTWIQAVPNVWLQIGTGAQTQQWAYYAVASSSGAEAITFTEGGPGLKDPGIHASEWSGQAANPIAATSSFTTFTPSSSWSTGPFAVPAGGAVVSIGGEEVNGSDSLTLNGQTSIGINNGQFSESMYQLFASASSTAVTKVTSNLSNPYAISSFIIQPMATSTPPTNFGGGDDLFTFQ